MELSRHKEPITHERIILVIDDAVEYLLIFKRMLEQYYTLAMAKSGEEALRVLNERMVDLILLDIEMPGMTGLELFNTLKENPLYRAIPVIFVSSYRDSQIITEAGKLGAKGYIIKPFTEEALFARIDPVLRRSSGKMAAIDLTMRLVRIEKSFLRPKRADDYEEQLSFEMRQTDALKTLTALRGTDKYIPRVKMEIERIYVQVKNRDTTTAVGRIQNMTEDMGVREMVINNFVEPEEEEPAAVVESGPAALGKEEPVVEVGGEAAAVEEPVQEAAEPAKEQPAEAAKTPEKEAVKKPEKEAAKKSGEKAVKETGEKPEKKPLTQSFWARPAKKPGKK
jgi:CheY-like chemotaxis protein